MQAGMDRLAGILHQAGQAMQAPDVAGILDLPAGTPVQGLHGAHGQVDRPGHDRGRRGDRGLVATALDRVLHLELELSTQTPEVDACSSAPQAVRDVFRAVRASEIDPPGRVGVAVQVPYGVFGPERAERQQALRGIRGSEEARACYPGVLVTLARALEDGPVTHTEPQPAGAVAAPGHLAGGQVPAPADLRTRVGDEIGHPRAASRPPAVAVARAELAPHRGAVAGRNRTRAPAQHQVVSVDEVDVGAELHANLRQELAQQPRTRERRRRCGTHAHSVTSLPVNQPAASNVARASSTLRWE